MQGYMHGHGYCDCTPWESLSKKDKLEILSQKKKWLEAKTKMVSDAMKEIEKSKGK